MLAIANGKEEYISNLYKSIESKLPPYAIPLFVRLLPTLELTGTHKIIKSGLKKDGYDPSFTKSDKVFALDRKVKKYVLLDKSLLKTINSGEWRI